jgi:hypothetical protein
LYVPGGAAASGMIRVLLSRVGLRKAMLIKAGIDAAVLGLSFLLIKERHLPNRSARFVWYDKKFLTDPEFWSLVACIGLCNLGFPVPYFYLPTFAKQKVANLSDLVCIF